MDVANDILRVLGGKPALAAVNAPFVDPETMEIVGPYMAVGEMVGRLATQIADGQWRSLQIAYQGEIANYDVTALKASVIAGLLALISDEHVNLVSVNNIIEQRGWRVTEEKDPDVGLYANQITVFLVTSDGTASVSGTLVHNDPRIVEIDGFRVDVSRGNHDAAHGHILILRNEDRPGRVGAVGVALGEMLVNISAMDVGKRDASGLAIMVLSVDRALTPAELQSMAAIPGIEHVKQAEI